MDVGELGKEIIYLGDMCPEMGLSVAEYIYFEFYSWNEPGNIAVYWREAGYVLI